MKVEWVNKEQILPINCLVIGQVFKYEGHKFIFIGSQRLVDFTYGSLRIVEMTSDHLLELCDFCGETLVKVIGKARIVIE